MNKIKVVQLARIPCANSGLELSNLINQYSTKYECRYILGNEYSKGCTNIPFRAFPTDLNWQKQKDECLKVIKEADIIHIHHDFWFEEIEALLVGKTVIVTLYNLCNSIQYRADDFNKNYIARMKKYASILTVADQPLQKKMFSDVTTLTVPLVKMLFNEQTIKHRPLPHIVFAPTNRDTGGIGKKMYYEVLAIIEKLKKENKFTFDLIEGVPYEENLARKQQADIIIDDVDPDYEKFHNTSIEAACFGAVPLTNFCDEKYPFVKTNIHNLEKTLISLISTPALLLRTQAKMLQWRKEEYTPEKLLKTYEDLYTVKSRVISKKELKDVTIFLITCGNNPNYGHCIEALNKQTVSFRLEIIKDIAPMSKAFQEMLDRCKTPYYIQVDNDMILKPNAIEQMYYAIEHTDVQNAMVCFRLHDTHLNLEIQGVKIYKHDIFKKYPYIDCLSCEMNQLSRMKKDGWEYLVMTEVLGEHSPYWTEEGIFDRYFIFMQKTDLKNLPQEVLKIYLANPTKINLTALLGAIAGILCPEKMEGDKNYKISNPMYLKLKDYFNEGTEFKFLPDENAISIQDFMKKLNNSKIKYWLGFESCLEVVETQNLGIENKKIIMGVSSDEKFALESFFKRNELISMQENVYVFKNFCIKLIEDKRVTEICQLPCFGIMVNVPKPVFPYLFSVFGAKMKK